NQVTAVVSSTGNTTNDVNFTVSETSKSWAIDSTGNVTVSNAVTVATANGGATSGDIVVGTNAGTNIGGTLTLTGTGKLLTGTAAATDASATSGSVQVFATGDITGTGTVETGVATVTDNTLNASTNPATTGSITLNGREITSDLGTGAFTVKIGTPVAAG